LATRLLVERLDQELNTLMLANLGMRVNTSRTDCDRGGWGADVGYSPPSYELLNGFALVLELCDC